MDRVRLLHQLSRSGGTLIAKCLASMHGVALLSEIHPLLPALPRDGGMPWAREPFNPARQARDWYGLASEAEAAAEPPHSDRFGFFRAQLARIAGRAEAVGLGLALRDYNHFDFTGVTRRASPEFRFLTAEALEPGFALLRVATVRHPLAQLASLARWLIDPRPLDPDRFFHGYRRFAEGAAAIGFLRYEDFLRDPEAGLRFLCERLALAYDPGWRDRWRAFGNVTGDRRTIQSAPEIGAEPVKPLPRGLVDAAAVNADYRASLALLGYRHLEA